MNGDLEKKLVASCRDGDRSAYSGLVRAYCGRVFAICLGVLGNSHDAEDVAQQALLKGLVDIKQLRDSERFGVWIGRIAKNLSIDFIRRQRRKRGALCKVAMVAESGTEEYPRLEEALRKLSQEYRLVLMLYYFDGHSSKNIAKVLEISVSAVQARLSRGRKRLRRLLEGQEIS